MISELKAFLLRGNVIDLAVAVVIGAAFTGIVSALVEGIITPLIGLIFGAPDFSRLVVEVRGQEFLVGAFLNAVINFVLVGTVLFLVVKAANKAMTARKREVEVGQATPEIAEDVALLREIRDALTGAGGAAAGPGTTPPPPPPAP
jgi:large conductance mechanosensitive channel